MNGCYFCGKNNAGSLFWVRFAGKDFSVARCLSCGLVYTLPRSSDKEQASYYDSGYYGGRKPLVDGLLNWLRARIVGRVARARLKNGSRTGRDDLAGGLQAGEREVPGYFEPEAKMRSQKSPLAGHPPQADRELIFGTGSDKRMILDVGCGSGSFLTAMERRGWEVAGTEISTAYDFSDLKSTGNTAICRNEFPECSLPAASFDAVTFWHVFEHLTDHKRYLLETSRVLKSGGMLIIEVPNFHSWQAAWGGRHWFHIDVPRHTVHFSPRTLQMMVESEGFQVEHIRYGSFFYDVFGDMQTMFNLMLSRDNLLFDFLGGRIRIKEYKADFILMGIFFVPALLAGLVLFPVAKLFGKSAVVIMEAKKA